MRPLQDKCVNGSMRRSKTISISCNVHWWFDADVEGDEASGLIGACRQGTAGAGLGASRSLCFFMSSIRELYLR